jgi:hypothetical protein
MAKFSENMKFLDLRRLTFGSTAQAAKVARVPLGVVTTGGGVFSWQNPEGARIVIDRVVLDITTQSTGASTIDIGATVTSATTSADNLIDGVSGATAGTLDNVLNAGTNGRSRQALASGGWVTASQATGAVAGLVGNAYIHYYIA